MSVTTVPDEIKLTWCNRGSQLKCESTRIVTNPSILEEIEVAQARAEVVYGGLVEYR